MLHSHLLDVPTAVLEQQSVVRSAVAERHDHVGLAPVQQPGLLEGAPDVARSAVVVAEIATIVVSRTLRGLAQF